MSTITDSQTVQAQIFTDTLVQETNSKFRLRKTVLLVACRTALLVSCNRLFQDKKIVVNNLINQHSKGLLTSTAHATWTHKTFRQFNGLKQRWVYTFEKYVSPDK